MPAGPLLCGCTASAQGQLKHSAHNIKAALHRQSNICRLQHIDSDRWSFRRHHGSLCCISKPPTKPMYPAAGTRAATQPVQQHSLFGTQQCLADYWQQSVNDKIAQSRASCTDTCSSSIQSAHCLRTPVRAPHHQACRGPAPKSQQHQHNTQPHVLAPVTQSTS